LSGKRLSGKVIVRETSCPGKWLSGKRLIRESDCLAKRPLPVTAESLVVNTCIMFIYILCISFFDIFSDNWKKHCMFRLHVHYYTYHLLDVFKTGFVYNSACLPRVDLSVMWQRSSLKTHQSEVLSLRTLLSDVYTEGVRRCATKQMLIYAPPAVLTLHLKRFEQVGPTLRRLSRHVNFSELLDLTPYCSRLAEVLCVWWPSPCVLHRPWKVLELFWKMTGSLWKIIEFKCGSKSMLDLITFACLHIEKSRI